MREASATAFSRPQDRDPPGGSVARGIIRTTDPGIAACARHDAERWPGELPCRKSGEGASRAPSGFPAVSGHDGNATTRKMVRPRERRRPRRQHQAFRLVLRFCSFWRLLAVRRWMASKTSPSSLQSTQSNRTRGARAQTLVLGKEQRGTTMSQRAPTPPCSNARITARHWSCGVWNSSQGGRLELIARRLAHGPVVIR